MPIYEFACPRCRKIFSFLSKRINPERAPICPKCGAKDLARQMSSFAMISGGGEAEGGGAGEESADLDDPKVAQVMGDLEKEMAHLDETNPKHVAHLMRKMKEIMPAGRIPKDFDAAVKRLEAGEDPEKIEQDMGDVWGQLFPEEEDGSPSRGSGTYRRDSGLYDY
jgi:putative FmdB family regulatory protein